MKLKFLIVAAVLATAILGFGGFVNAQTTDNSALIAQLQAQIQLLLQQIAQLQAQENQGQTWCHTFSTNLRIGDIGPEVEALMQALKQENFYISSVDQRGSGFSDSTASAVVGFQEKYASEILTPYGLRHGTGFVGKSTRAKLNALYGCATTPTLTCTDSDNGLNYFTRGITSWTTATGVTGSMIDFCANSSTLAEYSCDSTGVYNYKYSEFTCSNGCENGACKPVTNQPSITVTSPNGGEQWQQGTTHNITWNTQNISSSSNVQISLYDFRGGTTSSLIAYTTNSGSYQWTIPTSMVGITNTLGNNVYKAAVFVTDSANSDIATDRSDNYFSIVAHGTNLPPVISGVSGPTTLSIGQTGTWTISASDPENGTLSYSAIWGDETASMAAGNVGSGVYTQTATFTHSYSVTGNFTPIFYVKDSSGNTAKTSINVNVGSTTQPSITITSPNGGETWTKESTQTIKWQSNAILSTNDFSKVYDIKLVPYYPPCTSQICPMVSYPYGAPYTIATGVSGFLSNWYVGKIINRDGTGGTAPDGSYTIQICQTGSTICDSSDNYFSIVAPTTQPSITITSPNGGETWKIGETHNITWNINNVYYNEDIDIKLYDYSNISNPVITQIARFYNNHTTMFYSWTIPSGLNGSLYKIKVLGMVSGGIGENVSDLSDNYFSIVAPTVACTSFTYSAWSACSQGNQTRTVVSSSPAGCTGGNPILSQSCAITTSVFSNSQIYNEVNSKVPALSCSNYKCNGAFGYCTASCGGGYYPDNSTAQKLCQKKGYDSASSFTTKNSFFASCGDNYMWKWNGTAAEYIWSCTKNSGIDTVTCSKTTVPVASIDSQDQLASISIAIQRIAQQILELLGR